MCLKDLSFCSANPDGLFEGTTLEDKNRMIHLRKWNVEGKPFDRHSVTNIPFDMPEQVQEEDKNIGLYVDFTSSDIHNEDMLADDGGVLDTANIVELAPQDHRVWYNKMLNELQELSKLCETRPASMSKVLSSVGIIK